MPIERRDIHRQSIAFKHKNEQSVDHPQWKKDNEHQEKRKHYLFEDHMFEMSEKLKNNSEKRWNVLYQNTNTFHYSLFTIH